MIFKYICFSPRFNFTVKVIIDEKTKEGKKLLAFLKTQGYATIEEEESPVVRSMRESLDELKKAKENKLSGKPARQLLDEL